MYAAYRVVARSGGGFRVIYEPTGEVLLTTRNVSVETLMRVASDHFHSTEESPHE